jgi:hypothetical protein
MNVGNMPAFKIPIDDRCKIEFVSTDYDVYSCSRVSGDFMQAEQHAASAVCHGAMNGECCENTG